MKRNLHLNLRRQYFGDIAAELKKVEWRERTPYWKARLENRQYDAIRFRNGYATNAPEMLVEFLGVRRVRKGGKPCYALELGRILKISRWRG